MLSNSWHTVPFGPHSSSIRMPSSHPFDLLLSDTTRTVLEVSNTRTQYTFIQWHFCCSSLRFGFDSSAQRSLCTSSGDISHVSNAESHSIQSLCFCVYENESYVYIQRNTVPCLCTFIAAHCSRNRCDGSVLREDTEPLRRLAYCTIQLQNMYEYEYEYCIVRCTVGVRCSFQEKSGAAEPRCPGLTNRSTRSCGGKPVAWSNFRAVRAALLSTALHSDSLKSK